MKLRIHHFFDIIRDFGTGKTFEPHPYLHNYHKVADEIKNNPDLELEIVVESDAICKGCVHLVNGICDDSISHRSDFTSKEAFNNHLDKRIIEAFGIERDKKYTPTLLVKLAPEYIENIEFIYDGNDSEHTAKRKENVLKGLKYYANKYQIGKNNFD
jgi:hypothetical protein